MALPIARGLTPAMPRGRARANQDPLAIRQVVVQTEARERFALATASRDESFQPCRPDIRF
jgi:hypothetical protein